MGIFSLSLSLSPYTSPWLIATLSLYFIYYIGVLSILIFVQLIHSKFCSVQSDKRKGALLEKDPSKKARLEPDDIVFETADQEGGASSTPQVDTNNEKCANCNLSVTTPKVRRSKSNKT